MNSETTPGALKGALIAAWIFIIIGADMALLVALGLHGPLNFFLDLVFWPLDGAQSLAAPEAQLLMGIAGGLLAGWGVTLLILCRRGVAEQGADGWAWRAAMGGLAVWFLLDGAASVASGAWANVIGNLGFLLVIAIPLWMLRRPLGERAVP